MRMNRYLQLSNKKEIVSSPQADGVIADFFSNFRLLGATLFGSSCDTPRRVHAQRKICHWTRYITLYRAILRRVVPYHKKQYKHTTIL